MRVYWKLIDDSKALVLRVFFNIHWKKNCFFLYLIQRNNVHVFLWAVFESILSSFCLDSLNFCLIFCPQLWPKSRTKKSYLNPKNSHFESKKYPKILSTLLQLCFYWKFPNHQWIRENISKVFLLLPKICKQSNSTLDFKYKNKLFTMFLQ